MGVGSWLSTTFAPIQKGGSSGPSSGIVAPRTHNYDPMLMGAWGELFDLYSDIHPGSSMDYNGLRRTARVGPIAALIGTRIDQVAEFTVPQVNEHQAGFVIRLRDRKKTMSRAAERTANEIQSSLLNGTGRYGYGNFEMDVRAMVRDSLILDQANAEVLFTNARRRGFTGRAVGFLPADASTIRLAKPKKADRDGGQIYPEDPAFVQVMHPQRVVNEYKLDEMIWGIRRPRTNVAIGTYGFPELDELMRLIAALVNATTYNESNFNNGIHTNTLLAVKSTMDDTIWSGFKRAVMAQLLNPANANKTVMARLAPADSLEAVRLGESNTDMEFSNWINWLLKIICAMFSMDPAELGFVFGNEGQSGSFGGNSNVEQRIVASKERGLRPLLRALQFWLDHKVIRAMDEDFALEFVGLGAITEAERHKMDIEAAKVYKSPNDIRKERDLKPLDHPAADLPIDPIFQQAAGAEGGAGDAFDGADFAEPDVPDGFAVDSLKGADWGNVDDWTTRLVEATDAAMASGRIRSVPLNRGRSGGTRHALCKGPGGGDLYIVEVRAA